MKRALNLATIASVVLLVAQLVVCVWAISPRSRQYWPVTGKWHVSLWGSDDAMVGPLMFYNHKQLPKLLKTGIASIDGVAPTPTKWQNLGIYSWYLSLSEQDALWLVTVSLWYPIIFASILPAIWLMRRLIRTRCRFSLRTLMLFVTLVAFVFGSWSLTWQVGTRNVVNLLDRKYCRDGSVRIERNPMKDEELFESIEPEWHYLGRTSSPFPFIVAYEEARGFISPYTGNYIGEYKHEYYLWFFGANFRLEYWSRSLGAFL